MKKNDLLLLICFVSTLLSCKESETPDPPAPPSSLTYNEGDASVILSWSSVAGATGYNVYWSTTSDVSPATGSKIANVTSPYTHKGLTNGTTYYYVITAFNAGGESNPSPQMNATPQIPAPGVPSDLTVNNGNANAIILWSSVVGATSYNLYWSTTSGVSPATGSEIPNITSPYTHNDLTNGTTYYYVITAVNAGGESNPSPQVNATPQIPAPTAPSDLTTNEGDASVIISWSSVAGATGYNVYWSTTSGVSPTTGNKIANVASPYTHKGLTNGTTYYYVITAFNAGGESSPSLVANVTPQAPVYSIVYNGNGNVGGTTPIDSNTYPARSNATVLGNVGELVKDGYSFNGWNTNPDGSGTSYLPNDVIAIGKNIVLYAQWLISEMAEEEFNDSPQYANIILPLVKMTLRLNATSDQDWFSFHSSGNQFMKLEFIVPESISGMWSIYVYNPNMDLLSHTNWNGTASKTPIPCSPTGRYYIRITPYSNNFFYNDSNVQIKISLSPWE